MGILTYNEMPHTESHIAFNDYDNVDDLVVAVQNIPYKGKGTNTNSAVEWATQVGMTEAMGDRPDVKNFVVILILYLGVKRFFQDYFFLIRANLSYLDYFEFRF